MSNIQNQINELNKKISDLKYGQDICNHEWGVTKFNPHNIKVKKNTGRYEYYGVHMYPVTTWVDERKSRWTRICKICGKVEHTEKQREIKHKPRYEPDF